MRYKLLALTLAGITRIVPVSAHVVEFSVHVPTAEEYREAFETPAETFGRKMDERCAERERERDREQGDYDGAGCSCNQN